LFANYKLAYKQSYLKNSALITSFVEDCRKPQYAPHIAKIGLTADVNELEASNIHFDEVYTGRNSVLYDQKVLGSMVTIRPKVDAAFNLVANGINAAYASNELGAKDPAKREALTTVINKINSIIDNAELAYHRRAGVKKSGNKKPETPEIPETPDAPETPETPDDPPHLMMVNQRIYGNHPGFSSYATHMSAEAADPEAFAAA
jgi:hypothetical protein